MTDKTATTDTSSFDIVVVGGGIAGLVAALSATERGARVAVIESTSPGGRAKTTERDGYHYNTGPHALYHAGHLLPFLQARGLEPAGREPASKTIRIVRDGALHELTFSAIDLARTRLLSPKSRMRVLALLAKLPRMRMDQFVGTSWQDWLGNEPDDVAGLLRMLGRVATYVNAPATFDAGAALTQIKAALRGVRYLDGGWQTMVDSLAGAFGRAGGTVLESRIVLGVQAGERAVVETSLGALRADAVIVAGLSPTATAALTSAAVSGVERLGGPVHAAVLDLALDRVHDGVVFGVDEPLYLSPHAPVARLAPQGCGLVQLMRYVPDGETGATVDRDRGRLRLLAEQAGIRADSIVHERSLHRLVVANGFPTAAGGGLGGRPSATALGLDGVFVAGDWVGPRHQLADASSASGEDAATLAVAHIAERVRAGV
jgi:glycine/D-amino acid oxidase-like deaminating enzyme